MLNKSTLLGSIARLTSGAALLAAIGCTANVLGDGAGAGASPSGPGPGADASAGGTSGVGGGVGGTSASGAGPITTLDCTNRVIDPGPSPMRLLSRAQYLATVRDLAGDVPGIEQALGDTVDASAFGLVQPDVTQVELENFQKAADVIAKVIAGTPAALNKVAPCEAGKAPADCAKSAIQSFGERAYRAPVTDAADIDRHVQLFNVGAATSYQYGIEMLLRGMLQAPRFLYRVEIGTGEKVGDLAVKLSPHEIAARLSYTVWGTMPDAKLSQAIGSGALSTPEGVAAQLEWMLQDERGQKLVNRFLESWTHLGALDRLVKNPDTYPEFQAPSYRESLKGQAAAFFDDLLTKQGGKLSALFTSATVFYNKDTAGYYGLTGGDAFQSTQRSDGTAFGMLTLPAFLAVQGKPNESSPIYRGRFVREALLCQQLPPPPPNIPSPPEVTPGVSTRERLAQHEVNATCASCHKLIDPIGFGFEAYDTVGRYRSEDGGKPVDVSGEVVSTRDMDGKFNGLGELAAKLAQSKEVEECLTRQWFRFATDRFERESDGCSMKSVLDGFQAAGQDLNALPKAIVATDAFLYRRPLDAQVTP